MIKYGLDQIEELKFISFDIHIEKRDQQWVDINLVPVVLEGAPLPTDLIDFNILVICSHEGIIAQMVPQDVGCDCEYQLTFAEKEQVRNYIESDEIQGLIEKVVRK
ncbi:hypothetical protein [Paenibacillus endoradicis]|uniref:hypothetical protein n=1 Tax=Paenibacillus endoradicis TaxID=2972487 RepID=UPI0021593D9E|nr:hypothetical protein [Paenibacillus endoradicis]MCR8656807.1 hypothetical protein [Paenibacillus endoradicis]